MSFRLEGRPVSEWIQKDLFKRVNSLVQTGRIPKLVLFRVGERPDDLSYEKSISKLCQKIGILLEIKLFDLNVTQSEIEKILSAANEDSTVHGIMMFRPLPSHLNMDRLSKLIAIHKDVDCMSVMSLSRLLERNQQTFAPCTAEAIVELFKYHNVPLRGSNITVIGTSLVVGKPLALLLANESATVTMCHSMTRDVRFFSKNADIVVVATGTPKRFDATYFDGNTTVIDVGINDDGDGGICGDVDFDNVVDHVKAITPKHGGVGAITTTILLRHVVISCENNGHIKTSCPEIFTDTAS